MDQYEERGTPSGDAAPLQPSDPAILSALVHDLHGPLLELLTSMAMLFDDFEPLSPRQRAIVEGMERRGLLLHNRMENLACVAAIWSGDLPLQQHRVGLNELVSEVYAVVMPFLQLKRQKLRIETGDGNPQLVADPRRLVHLLVNLILHASEQSGRCSSIDVHVCEGGSGLTLSVADRGPGVVDEKLPAFFDLDEPSAGSATRQTAVGLAMARAIADAHGWSVGARSRKQGGMRVSVELGG